MTDSKKPNDKILERVKRLYAMSQDDSSVNEAAIALRRVKALMTEHGLTEADLKDSPFGTETAYSSKRIPTWWKYLSLGIAAANDCICSGARTQDGCNFEYKGFAQDVLLATLMQEYLVSTMERSWLEFKKTADYTGKSASTSFKNGFCSELQTRLFELAEQRKQESRDMMVAARETSGTGTDLVVTKMKMVNSEFGKQHIKNCRDRVSDGGANAAGRLAGSNVSLNSQVTGSQQRALGHG